MEKKKTDSILSSLPKEVLTKKGKIKLDLSKIKYFGLYFSAHWCGPCRNFTPLLSEFYKSANKTSKQIEIIFLSSDQDEKSFKEYFATMPWVANPFANSAIKEKLDEKFKVEGIPTLLIFNKKGELIDSQGRSTVASAEKNGKFGSEQINDIFEVWSSEKVTNENVYNLLFQKVIGKDGKNKKLVLGNTKYYGIYFSAHWCEPCRNFTPLLSKFYEAINKKSKRLEIIFISSDKNEKDFKEYYATMPWVALPLKCKNIKNKLDEMFNVEGIPTLLIFDSNNKLIDKDGRNTVVQKTEGGKSFSEKQMASVFKKWENLNKTMMELLPKKILTKQGLKDLSIKDYPFFGLYFSAHWCPPCQGFTPVLSKFYTEANKKQKKIEIIFLSSDKDENSFKEYFDTMPWVANPFSDKDTKDLLSDKCEVNGIPTLCVYNPEGKLVDSDGRGTVQRNTKNGDKLDDEALTKIFNKWNGIQQNVLDIMPQEFLTKSGKKEKVDFKDVPLIGLYFSAHWCPPCQQFTPNLATFYNEANKTKKRIEIIFVSSDKSDEEFKKYYDTMPWIANPFDNSDFKDELDDIFDVQGIPTLIIINSKTGVAIEKDGRMPVMMYAMMGAQMGMGVDPILDDWENRK